MKPFEEKFTAWVDGQLTGAELAAFERELAASHPDAAAEKADAERLRSLLRTHPTAPPLSNPDFFNLQLLQRIEADLPRKPARAERPAFLWPLSRLAWAGAFCLLVAFGLFNATIPTGAGAGEKSPYFAQVIESWPGADTISATTVYNSRDNVTVLWLEGLDYLPGSPQLQ